MVWAIIVSKHKSKSMRNIDWCSSRNYTSLNLTFIVHGEKHNFREENHSICSCCCPVAPVSRSLALQALRWMGAFGGWSLKRELGYGNLRLAQGITYYTCSFWKPKRSVIYIYKYTASILPRPYMHLLSEPMTRELREVIKCRKEILNKSMVKVAISKQGKKTV